MPVLLALSTTFLNATVKSGVLRHGHDRLCGSGTMAASVGRFQSCAVGGSSQCYADTRKRLGWLGCKAYPCVSNLKRVLCVANCRVMGYEHKAQPCSTPSNTCLFPIDEVLVHFQWWCLPRKLYSFVSDELTGFWLLTKTAEKSMKYGSLEELIEHLKNNFQSHICFFDGDFWQQPFSWVVGVDVNGRFCRRRAVQRRGGCLWNGGPVAICAGSPAGNSSSCAWKGSPDWWAFSCKQSGCKRYIKILNTVRLYYIKDVHHMIY